MGIFADILADNKDQNYDHLKYLHFIHQCLPVVLYCSSYKNNRWTIQYVSQQVTAIMGYQPEELIGRLGWQELTQDGDTYYQTIPKQSENNRRFHFTLKMRCASGDCLTFSDDGFFIYDANNNLTGSVGIFVDITAQKQAEEAMALEYRRLKNLIKRPISLFGMVGNSPPMQEVFSRIIKLAVSNAGVVIHGESGTGKELAARAIHELSNRAEKPFVAVNCGAISDSLFESEFFGHAKGSFTGAIRDHRGYLDQADGGTIFLDEVGEISPGLQAKLLRALDGYGYLPVGGGSIKKSDFRLIAATNRNIEAMVKEGTMRKDFYFRIKTFNLQLPPLRDRQEDIPLLAHYFMDKLSLSRRVPLSIDVMETLSRYSWPGNVRELQSVIYRYATFQELGLEDFRPPEFSSPVDINVWAPSLFGNAPLAAIPPPTPKEHSAPPDEPEGQTGRAKMLKALSLNGWNVSQASEYLGLSRATIYRKMKKWNITRPRLIGD